MYELTNFEKHLLQVTINNGVSRLKRRKKLIDHLSGKEAMSLRIKALHELKRKMGIEKGFSQQPETPREENRENDRNFGMQMLRRHVTSMGLID
jgi:hypothetical protein